MTTRNCLECREVLKGRSDKKFCDDSCRNVYNNRQNGDANNHVRKINNTLRRNRRILATLYLSNRTKIPLDLLAYAGYNFNHYTHVAINRKGTPIRYCYDYGYKKRNNTCYVLKDEQS